MHLFFRLPVFLVLSLLVLTPLQQLHATTYEDAESGLVDAWTVYDDTPEGANVSIVYDDTLQSNVIETHSSGRANGFILGGFNTTSGWNNETEFQVNWAMRNTEAYTVYVRVDTREGPRYLYYNQSNADSLANANGRAIHHGLGRDTLDGAWRTFSRDLAADLADAQPDNTLLAVNGFLIRGNVRVDNISLDGSAAPVAVIANGNRTAGLGENVLLDGSGSTDASGLIASFEWRDGAGNLVGSDATYSFSSDAIGVFPFLLTVTNAAGLSASAGVTVTVVDSSIATIYEDAEDFETTRWRIYDATPAGASIENLDNAEAASRVISLTGNGQQNGFLLGDLDVRRGGWNNQTQATVRWRMQTAANYRVYLRVDTSEGWRYLYYDQTSTDRLANSSGRYLHFALGSASKDGSWQTHQRDLRADLERAQPGNRLLAVQGFLFRGTGLFDDIQLVSGAIDAPPVAALSATPDTGQPPLEVILDASESSDDAGIASYAFDFGDDSAESSDSAIITHVYAVAGEYTAQVTVTDSAGQNATASQTVMVVETADNEAPVAALTADPTNGDSPLEVVFDGSLSSDNIGIVLYDWQFGDGTSMQGEALAQVEHSYVSSGSFTATLTVTDAAGNTHSQSLVIITDSSNAPPVALFSALPGNGLDSLTVTVDAADSSDDEGIVSYTWDFGDGETAVGETAVHTFVTAGEKTISLTVTDAAEQSATTTMLLTLVEPVGDGTAPVAVISADVEAGTAPLLVNVDASQSSAGATADSSEAGASDEGDTSADGTSEDATSSDDSTNGIAAYAWDFGNGQTADTALASVTYEQAGSYTITLTVTDADGLSDTATLAITVTEPGTALATREEAARLLTQATFGTTEADIAAVQALGIEGWIDDQFNRQGAPHLDYVVHHSNGSNREARHEVWWRDAIRGEDQLRQRVAFALSQIFVIGDTGYTLGNSQYGIANYYDMLREQAFGSYRQLLEDVTRSPVMGIYLSMLQNAKGDPESNTRPDENYAREVMQLFSIGLYELSADGTQKLSGGQPIPSYSQADVESYARVFTGWNYRGADRWNRALFTGNNLVDPMDPYPGFHDADSKTLLGGVVSPAGNSAEEDLSLALRSLSEHANVGPFIGKQLIQRLITSNPTPAYVARVSAVFNNNGQGQRGDLQAVVKAILLDPEARNGHENVAEFGKLREPMLRITHLWRAFNIKLGSQSRRGEYNTLSPHVKDLDKLTGQAPLRSPSVFNFYHPDYAPMGELQSRRKIAPESEIYTDNHILATTTRINTQIQRLYASTPTPTDRKWSYLDMAAENALASDPDSLLERLDLLLLSGGMSDGLRDILRDHMNGLPDTDAGRSQRVRDSISLIMASPEYLVQM